MKNNIFITPASSLESQKRDGQHLKHKWISTVKVQLYIPTKCLVIAVVIACLFSPNTAIISISVGSPTGGMGKFILDINT